MDNIKRNNENFFQDILSKDDKTIYSYDIDNQFNEIARYLDRELKPAIDELVSGAVEGVAGSINTFLHNVGDGTTDWQYVSNRLDDFSITLDKLVKINASSVLVTNDNGNLVESTPSSANEVLLSRMGNIPTWKLITSQHIEPKSITGNQLGILSMENFAHNLFAANVQDNAIKTDNIRDLNITNDKITNNSITADKFGVFNNLPVVTDGLTINNLDDSSILADKIKDNTIPVYYYIERSGDLPETTMTMWDALERRIQQPNGVHVWKMILPQRAILNNSIDDSKLHALSLAELSINLNFPNRYPNAPKALFDYYSVDLGFQFTSDHIANDSLDLDSFDKEVQDAINRL